MSENRGGIKIFISKLLLEYLFPAIPSRFPFLLYEECGFENAKPGGNKSFGTVLSLSEMNLKKILKIYLCTPLSYFFISIKAMDSKVLYVKK